MRDPARDRRKRLLIVAPFARRDGGAEQMLWTWLSDPDARRFDITVVFFRDGPLRAELEGAGHRVVVVATGRLRQPHVFLSAVARIRRIVRSVGPDVILSWAPKAHVYAAPAAVLAGARRRLVWWQHGVPERDALDRIATLLPAKAVGCSSAAGATAQSMMKPSRPTFVVHPAVAPEILLAPQAAESRAAARSALGFEDATFVVAIVGRLDRWKRQDVVIRAVALLRERNHAVAGLIIGGNAFELRGAYSAELEHLTRELGVKHDVRFTGQVDDVVPLLSAADVVVNASLKEPFGIVLIEAMSLGLPVIASDRGGPREIVEHGKDGLLLPALDASSLASTIEALIANPARAAALGERARASIARNFTANTMARRVADELFRNRD